MVNSRSYLLERSFWMRCILYVVLRQCGDIPLCVVKPESGEGPQWILQSFIVTCCCHVDICLWPQLKVKLTCQRHLNDQMLWLWGISSWPWLSQEPKSRNLWFLLAWKQGKCPWKDLTLTLKPYCWAKFFRRSQSFSWGCFIRDKWFWLTWS